MERYGDAFESTRCSRLRTVRRLRAATGASTAVCSLTSRPSPLRLPGGSPAREGGASRAGLCLTVGANFLRDRLDVLEELLPGLVRALLVLLDALKRVRHSRLDVTLVRAENLRLQLHRRGSEDLPDRGVAEERVLEAEDSGALEQLRLARQGGGPGSGEDTAELPSHRK